MNKLPLEYGPKEAEILMSLTKSNKLPSKNEGFRRGIVAADYLMDVDGTLLLEVLANSLIQARDSLKEIASFSEKLDVSKMLASEVVATFAVQKGIQSADIFDIFRADLDEYRVLVKTNSFKRDDKEEIANRLSFLSQLAYELAKKESSTKGKDEAPKNAKSSILLSPVTAPKS